MLRHKKIAYNFSHNFIHYNQTMLQLCQNNIDAKMDPIHNQHLQQTNSQTYGCHYSCGASENSNGKCRLLPNGKQVPTDKKGDERKCQILVPEKKRSTLSRSLVQKSINLLLKVSYLKCLNFETTLHSIFLLYSATKSGSALGINKSNIEQVLYSCLLISGKLYGNGRKVNMSSIMQLTSRKYKLKEIIQWESAVVEELGYCLHHSFPVLEHMEDTDQEVTDRLQFLTELVLLETDSVLFDEEEARELVRIAGMEKLEMFGINEQGSVLAKIIKVLQDKNTICEIVINKYRSKFDIVHFCGAYF